MSAVPGTALWWLAANGAFHCTVSVGLLGTDVLDGCNGACTTAQWRCNCKRYHQSGRLMFFAWKHCHRNFRKWGECDESEAGGWWIVNWVVDRAHLSIAYLAMPLLFIFMFYLLCKSTELGPWTCRWILDPSWLVDTFGHSKVCGRYDLCVTGTIQVVVIGFLSLNLYESWNSLKRLCKGIGCRHSRKPHTQNAVVRFFKTQVFLSQKQHV